MIHCFLQGSKPLFRFVDCVMNGVDNWRQGPRLILSGLAPNRPLAHRSIFSSHSLICPSIPGVITSSHGGGWGVLVGTPIYGQYRYVPRNRVWFLRFSVLE